MRSPSTVAASLTPALRDDHANVTVSPALIVPACSVSVTIVTDSELVGTVGGCVSMDPLAVLAMKTVV